MKGGGEEGRKEGTYLGWGQFMMTKLSTSSGCLRTTLLRGKRYYVQPLIKESRLSYGYGRLMEPDLSLMLS